MILNNLSPLLDLPVDQYTTIMMIDPLLVWWILHASLQGELFLGIYLTMQTKNIYGI